MQRKVIKHGPSSHIVVLPAKWVSDQELSAGDYVSVHPQGDRVTISSSKQSRQKTTEIDVTELDRTSIMLIIRAAYRQGHTTIHVRYTNPTTTHLRTQETVRVGTVIHTEINRLIGVEVVSQQEHTNTIQEISTPSTQELSGVYRKLFTMTKQVLLQLVSTENNDLDIEQRHDVITRMASFVIRTARRGADLTAVQRERILHAATSIDTIVDIIKYFYRDQEHASNEFVSELSKAFTCVERVVFSQERLAMREFQEHKAVLRKHPVERLYPVIDILSDIVVSHAHPLKNMNK